MNETENVSGATRDPLVPFVLTDDERDAVAALAARLSAVPPRAVDAPEWVETARELSCSLPSRLLARLRAFRNDPGPQGALLIKNLPVDGSRLPPTPVEYGSVERNATEPASTFALAMLQLGEMVAYRPEKSGALVQNVVPVPGQEKQQSNAGSELLELHIENAFHPHRPDYVGLMCLRSDPSRVGKLCVAAGRLAVPLLSDDLRQVLHEDRYVTDAPPSFGMPEGGMAPQPILLGDWDDPDVRVDFNATHAMDPTAERAMLRLKEAFLEVIQDIDLDPGDLAIVDNRVTAHGRTAFDPVYDGNDRWLQRIFVKIDYRRTRPARPDNALVMD
jgi:L-asparagine oxygenase